MNKGLQDCEECTQGIEGPGRKTQVLDHILRQLDDKGQQQDTEKYEQLLLFGGQVAGLHSRQQLLLSQGQVQRQKIHHEDKNQKWDEGKKRTQHSRQDQDNT